ncbi:MAG: pectate lyase [Planctomycetota bacterium]
MPQRMVKLLALLFALLSLPGGAMAVEPGLADKAVQAMKKATTYFTTQISTRGGYLWEYSEDLKTRAGEGKANEWQIWIQPPGTPSVGLAYLKAYEATGDKQFLDAAVAAAKALAWGQLESGGWDYKIDFSEKGGQKYFYRRDKDTQDPDVRKRINVTTFDDNNTQAALRLLMTVDQLVDDPEVRTATRYGLEGMLKAQYANGAWPQRYPVPPPTEPKTFEVKKIYPDGREEILHPPKQYAHYYTFNDNAMNDCITVMLEARKRYGEQRFLDSAKRGGDFMIASQLKPPQAGWAQQYDMNLQPEWARKFEPKAVCPAATSRNIRTLVTLYLDTGEEKYLKPIPAALEWLETCKVGADLWPRFVEIGTNKALYMTKDTYHLVYTDDNLPMHYSFKSEYGVRAAAALYKDVLAAGRDKYLETRDRQLSAEEKKQRAKGMEFDVQKVIEKLDDQGRWLGKDRQIYTNMFIRNMNQLSTYVSLIHESDKADK